MNFVSRRRRYAPEADATYQEVVYARVWQPSPEEFRSKEFFNFFDGIGTGIEKICYLKKSWKWSQKNSVPKKVSELVLKKMSTEKSLGIGFKNFGTEKSLGIGIVQILSLSSKFTHQMEPQYACGAIWWPNL